jgi:disulfide bond formation protein DsbB
VTTEDLTDIVSTVLAVGALLLQVLLAALLLIALAALAVPAARRLLVEIRDTLAGTELWIAGVIALVATLGSLYYSEVADFLPCRLCWFQRIAMYPLAVVLLVAAWRRDVRGAFAYAITLPVVGLLVSGYHVYIELNPEAESQSCKAGGASCSVKWIEELGYITIPVLAGTAFAAIVALLLLARSRDRDERARAAQTSTA